MLIRYLAIVLTGGVVMGSSINDFSESALNRRAPDLHHVSNYYRRYHDGFDEIGYKYVIKPGHYGWLWMSPLAAGITAAADAAENMHTHYFDSSTGNYIGDNREEARRRVANKVESRRRSLEAAIMFIREGHMRVDDKSVESVAAEWMQRQREAEERGRRLREDAGREIRQGMTGEVAGSQREAAERERYQREAAERERRQRVAAERERRQKEAAEREKLRREASARDTLISEGNALLLADKYKEALSKFEQVLLTSSSNEEALKKRNLVNNVLDGNKWWDKADKELQAANESRLKRDYNNALTHYLKALAQYRLAVRGFEKAMIQDSKFKGKLVQAKASVTDLEATIAEVKLEAERKGVKLDVNWNVGASVKDVVNEAEEENINAEAETHAVVDRG